MRSTVVSRLFVVLLRKNIPQKINLQTAAELSVRHLIRGNAMEEIGNLIKSPAFWVSSVIIAFLMSFFASYAKDWTKQIFHQAYSEER